MKIGNGTGEGTSELDKFSIVADRMHRELGGKLLDSLRIKARAFEWLHCVSVVDGAIHSQEDDVSHCGRVVEAP
jgi:hypothetical protein